jgi:hypothetical protein
MTFTIVHTMKIEIPTFPIVSKNCGASRRALVKPRRLIWAHTAGCYPVRISRSITLIREDLRQ